MINDPFLRLNLGFGQDFKKKTSLEQLVTEALSMLYKYGSEELDGFFSHGKGEKYESHWDLPKSLGK